MSKFFYIFVLFFVSLFANPEPVPQKKLRIFLPTYHGAVTESFASAFTYLGHTLLLQGQSFHPKNPGFSLPYLADSRYEDIFYNKEKLSKSFFLKDKNIEIIENDTIFFNPPDVLIIPTIQQEKPILAIWKRLKAMGANTKLAYFSGHTGPCGQYDWNHMQNIILTDLPNYRCAQERQIPNFVLWICWVDFDHWKYQGPSDSLIMGQYIGRYITDLPYHKEIMNRLRIEMGKLNLGINIQYVQNKSHHLLNRVMQRTFATIHVKHDEGFGYAILESLACGRPVFLYRGFINDKHYTKWCIEGKTAFYFDTPDEFCQKLHKLVVDREYRHYIQETTAKTVREIINNEEQAQILQTFLDNLQ